MTTFALEFINLLPDLYAHIAGEEQDTLDIPKLTCKFVMIQQNGSRSLVLGNVAEYPYHANLVNCFCEQRQIASEWERKPDLVTVCDKETRVLGGGWMEIKPVDRSLRIFGSSTAYGRFLAREVRVFIKSEPFFKQFNITLDSSHSNKTL